MKKSFLIGISLIFFTVLHIQSSYENETVYDSDSDIDSVISDISTWPVSPVNQNVFEVSQDDAQVRMLQDVNIYSLDQVLKHSDEHPEYYGYAGNDVIAAWYQEAEIKRDVVACSLEDILAYAQTDPEYKGHILYQDIVDMYYKVHPNLIESARQVVRDAGKDLFLDSVSGITSGMQKFLMAYRKLPSGKQEVMLYMKSGPIVLGGISTTNAKVIVDWMKQNKGVFGSTSKFGIIADANSEIVRLLDLLDQ